MMVRIASTWTKAGAVVLLAVIAAGCGGAPEATDTGTATSPTPDPSAGSSTVAQPGATDPSTGQPVDPNAAATSTGATASVPDLNGGNVSGGLADVSGESMFQAHAVDASMSESTTTTGSDFATGGLPDLTSTQSTSTSTTSIAPTYSGAKIYVDGVTYTVDKGGSFPKGNPMFKLLSVSGSEIEVGLISGVLSSTGGDGVFLDKGDLVSLVNQTDQQTYKVKYLRPVQSSSSISF